MLPTPGELRMQAARFHEAATAASEPLNRLRFAGHALSLTKIAEAMESEGKVVSIERRRHYETLLRPFLEELARQRAEAEAPKPPPLVADAQRQIRAWRMRAEEIRRVAREFMVPSAQETMFRVADNYDRLAQDAERTLGMQPPIPRDEAS